MEIGGTKLAHVSQREAWVVTENPLIKVKKVKECWLEQDKLEVVERINHHLKGEDVVDILKCFPIGSQSRVVASRSLGPKCSGSSNRNSLFRQRSAYISHECIRDCSNSKPADNCSRHIHSYLGIRCSEIVEILHQFLPKNWEWQIECLQQFASRILDPNNHQIIVNSFTTRNGTQSL